MSARAHRLRCAIYTRKSSEEGLEQEFNSLDAQRDACAAFIASQAGLGWRIIADRYDDGGISGGTMARPALQRLLDDVGTGKVDIVVVYKIDRLTRSLADFARIVEIFDKQPVSFVSVTQAFNTTSSMGRLTLNVLLSFAQFEREVTGERIRDKIAASKKKGIWMGGTVPFGYEVRERKLLIQERQAHVVRQVFASYRELGSIRLLQQRAAAFVAEAAQANSDADHSGATGTNPASGETLSYRRLKIMLSNPIYVGDVRHGKEIYRGQHEAIVARELFDAVQAIMADKANRSVCSTSRDGLHILAGMLFDETGDRLGPTHATKGGKRYRYYVSRRMINDRRSGNEDGWRMPAEQLERVVLTQLIDHLRCEPSLSDMVLHAGLDASLLRQIFGSASELADRLEQQSRGDQTILRRVLQQIIVGSEEVRLLINVTALMDLLLGTNADQDRGSEPHGNAGYVIACPIRLRRRGVETRLVIGNGASSQTAPDPALVALIARAHRLMEMLTGSSVPTMSQLADREHLHVSDLGRILRLAFLAPKITEAILTGAMPVDMTPREMIRIRELPLLWRDQAVLFTV